MDDFVACAGCDLTVPKTEPEGLDGWHLEVAPSYRLWCPGCWPRREAQLAESEPAPPLAA